VKPVIIDSHFEKLKEIIESASSTTLSDNESYDQLTDIENDLKHYNDDKENSLLLYGSSITLILLSIAIIYFHNAYWPIFFLVVWLIGFAFYRQHIKSIIVDNLNLKSKLSPPDLIPKIDYIISAIDIKLGRKQYLQILLALYLSSSLMMAHILIRPESFFNINLLILLLAIPLSYFFWNNYYSEEIQQLEEAKSSLMKLKTKLVVNKYQQPQS